MVLDVTELAGMIDVSCVRTTSSKDDIDEMVAAARKYSFGHVSVLQCFIPYTRLLLVDAPEIKVIGNVSFPSGSDSTAVKVFQAKEMVAAGCDEIDMVMNIGRLRSGQLEEVENDVRAVIQVAGNLPVKVIIEIMYLSQSELEQACNICILAGAAFVKTGSGWADRSTTLEDIQRIKTIVGERIKIKASGGIRDLTGLLDMYHAGARRFGINLKSAVEIVERYRIQGAGIEF